MKRYTFLLFFFCCTLASAQVIDIHTHSYIAENYWGGRTSGSGVPSPKSVEEHLEQTIAEMDKNNIEYAIVSGWTIEGQENYREADPRFIPGYMDEGNPLPLNEFEELIKQGKIKVFGEITGVYYGKTLNDPMYGPYLKLCEKYDIPVLYHSGGAPRMAALTCCPDFRLELGDPYLIEEVIVKYPGLRIILAHAGEVYFERAIRLMSMYEQVYAGLGVLLWIDPLLQDYAVRFLKLAQTAGVMDKVMYGSDQMVWPGGISRSIDYLNSLDFLSQEEKHLILFENARRFFKLGNQK